MESCRPNDLRRDDDEDDRPRRSRREEDEEDDRPRRSEKGGGNGMAVTALVLGILSFFCSFLTGLPAVLFGILGLTRASKTGSGKGMAIAGMALGHVGTSLAGVAGYYAFVATKKGVERIKADIEQTSGNLRTQNDLKEVTVAFHHHHDSFGYLPRSYVTARGEVEPSVELSMRLIPSCGELLP